MTVMLLVNLVIALLWIGCGIGVVALWVLRYRKQPFMKSSPIASFRLWLQKHIIPICLVILVGPLGLIFCVSVEISLLIIKFCGKIESIRKKCLKYICD